MRLISAHSRRLLAEEKLIEQLGQLSVHRAVVNGACPHDFRKVEVIPERYPAVVVFPVVETQLSGVISVFGSSSVDTRPVKKKCTTSCPTLLRVTL